MATWPIDAENGLFHRHAPPAAPGGKTLVFFNALTGDTAMWEGPIAAKVRAAGHGTLSFNYRGQAGSPYAPGTALDAALIVGDACRLIAGLNPVRPLLVGLSIGGLFAAHAWLAGLGGSKAEGLVLVNTLRRDGPRLRWINDALVRCAEVGGLELFRDLYAPLLFGEAWQERNRASFLKPEGYRPLPRDSGHYNLLRHAGTANWDLPYENLALPVLVMTGLQDRVFYDRDDVARIAARLPRARRVDMAAAGHLLPAELPEEFAAALLDFAGEI
jgi:3-oxoadipate enol-lactonase